MGTIIIGLCPRPLYCFGLMPKTMMFSVMLQMLFGTMILSFPIRLLLDGYSYSTLEAAAKLDVQTDEHLCTAGTSREET